jgi:hypothetical protein
MIFQISASCIVWDDRLLSLCPALDRDEVFRIIYPGCPQTAILPISASQVARIAGVGH